MNRKDVALRAQILHCLCEGNSMRATARLTGASVNTVMKLLAEIGESCEAFHFENVRGLQSAELQLDEVWAFVGAKENQRGKTVNEHQHDVWCWTAIDADTKIIASWHLGDRTTEDALVFCADLSCRVGGRGLQVSTDGLKSYRIAMEEAFKGEGTSFAQLVKVYGKDKKGNDVVIRADKVAIFGTPDVEKVSTSYVERQNLSLRMGNRRYTRKTNAFSKKLENHAAALALYFFHYNFIRRHMTLKTTPAVAAGIAEKEWTFADLLAMHDERWANLHPVNRPKSYKKRSDSEEISN